MLFVCGSSRNRDRFLPYFTKIFNLRVDDDTMRRRLQERTNNEYGKQPEEVELMLMLNRSDEKPAGAIDVDATQPLHQVVDELLRLANCRTVTSDSTLTPWSKRASATGQSFVICESALPIVQAAASPRKRILRGTSDEFWDVLGRETITRIEYAWSGYVLATLLPYLDEQGIDLLHSDHDEVASTLSQTREGSVFVLTSDHRERYLARLDPKEFDGQCFAATTRSSTRRQQRASITQCWTGLLSFVTRSRLSNPRSWPFSSSDSPCSGRVRSTGPVFGNVTRRSHCYRSGQSLLRVKSVLESTKQMGLPKGSFA